MAPRWRYLLAEVGIGLRRNLLMTIATVVTVTVSLALLGVGMLIRSQVDLARTLLYQEIEVSIFLLDSVTDQQRADFEEELTNNPEVESVLYESKQEAYERARQIFAGEEALLDTLGPEDLPASFRVSLHNPENFDIVRSQYVEYPGVDTVLDQRDSLDRFFQLMNSVQRGAVIIALFQLIAAAALIANTIRLTAFARRDQTGIMKLVGATNWYIRMPFVLEGIATGVAGAVLAGGLLLLGMVTLVADMRQQIAFVPFIGVQQVLAVVPWLVLMGGGIAAVAAFLSLRRFLDV